MENKRKLYSYLMATSSILADSFFRGTSKAKKVEFVSVPLKYDISEEKTVVTKQDDGRCLIILETDCNVSNKAYTIESVIGRNSIKFSLIRKDGFKMSFSKESTTDLTIEPGCDSITITFSCGSFIVTRKDNTVKFKHVFNGKKVERRIEMTEHHVKTLWNFLKNDVKECVEKRNAEEIKW